MNSPDQLPPMQEAVRPQRRLAAGLDGLMQAAAPTIGEYIRMLRARKWTIGLITLLAVIIAVIVVQNMTPIYRASTMMMMEPQRKSIVSIEDFYQGTAGTSREAITTNSNFIRSREVTSRVVDTLGLSTHPEFDPRQQQRQSVTQSISAWLRSAFGYEEPAPSPAEQTNDGAAPGIDADVARQLTVQRVIRNLTVTPIRQSTLIDIKFESANPELAAEISNAIGRAFIRADLDARFNVQQEASKWLAGRLNELKVVLEQSEKALQDYREKSGIVVTPNAGLGGNVSQLESASQRLVQARVTRAEAQQVFRQVRSGAANRFQVPAVLNNEAVITARQAETAAKQKVTELAQSLGAAHPVYRNAVIEYKAAKDNTRLQSEAVISSLAKSFEVARATERAIEKEIAASRGSVRDINRLESRLTALEREVSTNRKLYELFLDKVKATDATADFRTPVARVVDEAVAPIIPIKPQKPLIVLLAGIAALTLAGALAISLEMQTIVIRSSDDVSEKLGIGLLAAIPKAKGNQLSDLAHIQHSDSRSPIAEAIRSAVTGIQLLTMEEQSPVIAVSSSLPGEGKTTIAINIAAEMARTKRVLLIEADMIKPAIGKYLGMSRNGYGLADAIADQNLELDIQVDEDTGVSVLFAGHVPKNSLDLLMSEGFRHLLQKMRSEYDVVIIDSPPMELVSDALPIGRIASGMIFVVKANSSPLPIVQRALARAESADINLFGVILNAHDFERASKYYGEYTAYGNYGYGNYGYGQDEQASQPKRKKRVSTYQVPR